LPLSSRLVRSAFEAPLLVTTGEQAPLERLSELRSKGCECLTLPSADGLSLAFLLDELGRRRMTNVLVEGGATVLGGFLDAKLIDEVHIFIAPLLIGGAEAKSPVTGRGVDRLRDGTRLCEAQVRQTGSDVYVRGCFKP